MGRKKVTSSDVAAASGVSQATVSMILNRRENVSFSRETVEKVEAAAKELEAYTLHSPKFAKFLRQSVRQLPVTSSTTIWPELKNLPI